MTGRRLSLLTRLVLLALAVALVPLRTISAQEMPGDEATFTARIAEMLSKALPDHEISVKSPLTLDVKLQEANSPAQANLDRIWIFCSRNRGGCMQAVDEYVAGVTSFVRDRNRPADVSMVRIVLRPASYLEDIQRTQGMSREDLVAEPFAGDLWMLAVIDMPRTVKFLSEVQLAELKVTRAEALNLGKRNVAAGLRPLKTVIREIPPQGFGYLTGDTYESSRIALHDEWADFAKTMKGKLIVAVPAPDLLLYGDSGNPNAVDAMNAFARDAARRAQRGISSTIFEWTPEGWRAHAR